MRQRCALQRVLGVGVFLFFPLLSFSAETIPASVSPPAAVRAVQCGSFPSSAEASELVARLQAAGYGPVWQVEEAGKSLVLVGRCENLTDAWLLRGSLLDSGFDQVFTKTIRNESGEQFATDVTQPGERLLSRKLPRFEASLSTATASRTDLQALRTAVDSGDPEAVIREASAARSLLADNDPAKGQVLVRLGEAMVARDKKSLPSLPHFLAVANGEVAASEEDQIEARFMAADSWHYYFPNPLRGYTAYKEILELHGDRPAVRARALIEIAACQLELARREKAYYSEVRRTCELIAATVPAEYDRVLATADLIRCESYMYEGLKEQSLEEFTGFEARHPNRPREQAMAKIYQGFLNGELGNWEPCKAFYQDVMETAPQEPEESFYWAGERWNLKEKAASALRMYAVKFGDEETRTSVEKYLTDCGHCGPEPAASVTSAFPHKFYQQ